MKKYNEIMKKLKDLADESGMVSLDAVAEVVNQELDEKLTSDADIYNWPMIKM